MDIELEALIAIALLALGAVSGYYIGERLTNETWEAKTLATARAAKLTHDVDVGAANKATTDAEMHAKTLDEHLTAALASTRTVNQIIHDKVLVYVTAKADAACTIPVGFVRVHDAAATGGSLDPGPTAANGGDADAPSAVTLSRLATTLSDNYGEARESAVKLAAWNTYADDVNAWWNTVKGLCNGR